jgi:hypothetical protein
MLNTMRIRGERTQSLRRLTASLPEEFMNEVERPCQQARCMQIISADHHQLETHWERFRRDQPATSWRYLPKWIQYQRQYAARNLQEDLSFVAVEKSTPLAICPLFLEAHNDSLQLSYAGGHQVAPLVKTTVPDSYRRKVEDFCYKTIDAYAKEKGTTKAMIMNDQTCDIWSHNELMRYGYVDSSISTAVIDLSLSEPQLWANLRKSFKPIINKALKQFSGFIMDWQNATFAVHELYRDLHRKAAGRVTRPKETFDLQFQLLKDNNAILIGMRQDKEVVALTYFIHNGQNAYYASDAKDPDFRSDVPVQHAIIWQAIRYYREKGFGFLDLGWQHFGHQLLDHPSKKDMDISFFKRGFGGRLVPLYQGTKYYDREYMRTETRRNLQLLLRNYET